MTWSQVTSSRRVPGGLTSGHLFEFVWLAANDQLRHINIPDMVAALGLIHVMSGDEKRHALPGEFEEKIP